MIRQVFSFFIINSNLEFVKNNSYKLIFFLLLIVLVSCNSDTRLSSENEMNQTVPVSIKYNPNSIDVIKGNSETSPVPIIDDGNSKITEILVTAPNPDHFIVNKENGQITIKQGLAIGTYAIQLRLSNSIGSKKFPNIFTFKVIEPANPPQSISYTLDTLIVEENIPGQSPIPIVDNGGASVSSYSLINKPAGFTISQANGRITASNTVKKGIYKLSVRLKNIVGSSDFNHVLTVKVIPRKTITFRFEIKPLFELKCSPCHMTDNGSQVPARDYRIYSNVNVQSESILNAIESGAMPRNGSMSENQKQLVRNWINGGNVE